MLWCVVASRRVRSSVTHCTAQQSSDRSNPLINQSTLINTSGFTRFFLAYYGFNLLNVLLRVQVHILGRYAFESSKREMEALLLLHPSSTAGSSGSSSASAAAAAAMGKQLAVEEAAAGLEGAGFGNDDRYRLLSLVYEFFLGAGLKRLKEVRPSVSQPGSGWMWSLDGRMGAGSEGSVMDSSQPAH